MNPLTHPEFWLSLSFVIVVGLVIFPPIRQRIQKFFGAKRAQVETDIQKADEVYQEALTAHQQIVKELKRKPVDKKLPKEIKALQQEFDDKIATQIQIKEQDFHMRQNLMLLQMKDHLRTELLDKVEDKIKANKKKTITEKEINHFIQMLTENETQLKKSLE